MPNHQTLESLFECVVSLESESDRDAFLAASCGDNSVLRAELVALLAAHRHIGTFMELPAADLVATAQLSVIAEKPGSLIGPYKLLEQIGEGGMGLVFMAEQTEPLRRRVALKIIKPGLDTRSVIARFEAERQALALMEHANIARVFDAGESNSGRPYFAMELVRGTPITEYCCEHNVSLAERLRLFIVVCEAVQHAHQKGIIHRDLKPTNILVAHIDTRAEPKVIDFGVAKAVAQQLTDRTLFTAFTQIIGTPLYMSPEQADSNNQDVDTRSDVYSLGVVLYELLTSVTPFDAERLRGVGADEIRRIIREEEPPKPSTRATTANAALSTLVAGPQYRQAIDCSALKGDLDWIVMKAIEKDRKRRYQSPSALAADLARHLNNQPVDASPPTRRYRLLKFARRNRAILLTTGAIAAALLLGIGTSVWQAIRARYSEQRATQALSTAEARLKTARQAVDEMYSQVAEKWLFKEGVLTPVQREFLQKAVAYYQEFAAEHPDSPQARFDIAVARRRQAYILNHLGDAAAAEAAYSESIEQLGAALSGLSNPADGGFELGVSLQQLGQMMRTARRYGEAIPLLKRAVSTLEEAAALNPSEPKFRRVLGRSYFSLASVYLDYGCNKEARVAFLRCRDLFAEVLRQEPENAWNINYLAVTELSLAKVLTNMGQNDEARPLYLHSIELHRSAVENDRDESLFRRDLALAISAASAGDAVEDHLKYDREAYEIARKLVGQFPDRPTYLEQFVINQINYSITLEDHDRKKMLSLARSALDSARQLKKSPGNPDYHWHFVQSLLMLHAALLANDMPEAATEHRRQAIEQVRADPECRQHLGYLRKYFAADSYGFGQWEAAISLMEECLAEDASQAGPMAWVVLALAHARAGDMDLAHTWLEKATPLPEPRPKSELTKKLHDEAVEVFDLAVEPDRAN